MLFEKLKHDCERGGVIVNLRRVECRFNRRLARRDRVDVWRDAEAFDLSRMHSKRSELASNKANLIEDDPALRSGCAPLRGRQRHGFGVRVIASPPLAIEDRDRARGEARLLAVRTAGQDDRHGGAIASPAASACATKASSLASMLPASRLGTIRMSARRRRAR